MIVTRKEIPEELVTLQRVRNNEAHGCVAEAVSATKFRPLLIPESESLTCDTGRWDAA